jgi:hypothetical protein
MPTTILICGSPADGFQVIGLFADRDDAQSYAEDYSLKDWWIAELTSPEAFADRRNVLRRAADVGPGGTDARPDAQRNNRSWAQMVSLFMHADDQAASVRLNPPAGFRPHVTALVEYATP